MPQWHNRFDEPDQGQLGHSLVPTEGGEAVIDSPKLVVMESGFTLALE
jgi:hypothetical protein